MELIEISNKVEEIRAKYGVPIPLTDSYTLVYKTNGHVRSSCKFGNNNSGEIMFAKDTYKITVNEYRSEKENNVSIAQIVGVYFLHGPGSKTFDFSNKKFEITKEMMDDGFNFAQMLLIPQPLLAIYFKKLENIKNPDEVIIRLSNIFNVPEEFLICRALNCGFLKIDKKGGQNEES